MGYAVMRHISFDAPYEFGLVINGNASLQEFEQWLPRQLNRMWRDYCAVRDAAYQDGFEMVQFGGIATAVFSRKPGEWEAVIRLNACLDPSDWEATTRRVAEQARELYREASERAAEESLVRRRHAALKRFTGSVGCYAPTAQPVFPVMRRTSQQSRVADKSLTYAG